MSLADDKFLPSGTYAIINAEYNRSLNFDEEDDRLSATSNEYTKWTIQSSSDVFADLPPEAEEGEDIIPVKSPPKPHQWVIKRHLGTTQSYIIYSPSQPQLFWCLPNGEAGTTPQLSPDHDSASSLWKFKKMEPKYSAETADATKLFVPAAVERPTQLSSEVKNLVAITIPPGWLTTITSVSYGNCINLIRICRTMNGALEKQDLVSRWDTAGKAMTIDGSDSDTVAIPVTEDAFVLIIEAFHSQNQARKDPSRLPGFKDLSTSLRVIANSRPKDMKSFPDSQMFTIFDESLGTTGSGQSLNAIITIHSSTKVAVDLDDPGKPDPGTVNEGYNEELDRPRPSFMDDWLEKYRAIFIVDDSSAMINSGAWVKAKDAVFRVATEVMQYDANGISVYFLNSLLYQDVVTSPADVEQIFSQVEPQGASPIGARLEFVLNKVTDQLEQAKNSASEYSQIKPIHIVVLTNSPSSDNVAKVIRSASRKLNDGLHHPNAVSIQFVQVGNDDGAEKALKKLSEDPSFNIVDSVCLGTKFSPEALQKSVLGTMHPSVRAKVASTSGSQLLYYRLYNKDIALTTKRPAYLDNHYIGRVRSKWVAPPPNAGSLRLLLCAMENVDPDKTVLFLSPYSKTAIADDVSITFNSIRTPGIIPEEPLLLFTEAIPMDGLKPGTEPLRVPPDAQSPLTPLLLYYGLYTESGATASKVPIDKEDPWISEIDLDLLPPPPTVATLIRTITAREGISSPSQLFANQSSATPLNDNDSIVADDGQWLGPTADDYVRFKYITQPIIPPFVEGAQYRVLNRQTSRALVLNTGVSPGRDLYLFDSTVNAAGTATTNAGKYLDFTLKRRDDGGVALHSTRTGTYVGPNFMSSATEVSLYVISSTSNPGFFFICADRDHRQAFLDPEVDITHNGAFRLDLGNFDKDNTRQMWSLFAL